MDQINIYTDGAAKGNPGPGGYGIILEYNGIQKEISEGFRLTTNNRMELLAVIVGLENIKQKGYKIKVFSDSKYVVEAINQKWVFKWEKINYKKKKNSDLWKRFLKIYREHNVTLHWVKGHSGHIFNEKCDQLAVSATTKAKLAIDVNYEQIKNSSNTLFD